MAGRHIRQIVSDLGGRAASIPKLNIERQQQNSESSEISPLQQAMAIKEQMLAMKVVDSSTQDVEDDLDTQRAETEARRMEAEATKLEAQAKLEELKAKTATDGGSGQITELVMQMLSSMREENITLKEKQADTQNEMLVGMVGSFREELRQLRQDMLEGVAARNGNGTAGILSRIEEVSAARDALAPFFSKTPELSGAKEDIQAAVLMHRLNAEQEVTLAKIRGDEKNRDHEHELDWARFNQEKSRSEGLINVMREVAPAINMMARQRTGMATAPAEDPVPSVATQTMPCPVEGCNGEITIAEGQDVATCPVCQTVMRVQRGES